VLGVSNWYAGVAGVDGVLMRPAFWLRALGMLGALEIQCTRLLGVLGDSACCTTQAPSQLGLPSHHRCHPCTPPETKRLGTVWIAPACAHVMRGRARRHVAARQANRQSLVVNGCRRYMYAQYAQWLNK
jgi:hypothetical protein